MSSLEASPETAVPWDGPGMAASVGDQELRVEVAQLREALLQTDRGIERAIAEARSSREMVERGRAKEVQDRAEMEATLQGLNDGSKRLQAEANTSWFSARRAQAAVRQSKERIKEQVLELEETKRRLAQENAKLRKEALSVRTRVLNCRQARQRRPGVAGGAGGVSSLGSTTPAAQPARDAGIALQRSHSEDALGQDPLAAWYDSNDGSSSLQTSRPSSCSTTVGIAVADLLALKQVPVVAPPPTAAVERVACVVPLNTKVAHLLGEAELRMQQQLQELQSKLEQVRAMRRFAEGDIGTSVATFAAPTSEPLETGTTRSTELAAAANTPVAEVSAPVVGDQPKANADGGAALAAAGVAGIGEAKGASATSTAAEDTDLAWSP